MSNKIFHSRINIIEPILESDFEAAKKLVEDNLYKDINLQKQLRESSAGEVLVAKIDERVVGMLAMRRPGKVFKEIGDRYFEPENLKIGKDKIGYIALVSVDAEYQGHGIGKKLVARAIVSQKNWNASEIIAHASESSPGNASERLFSSFAFIPTKLHKQPWHDYSLKEGPEVFLCNFCGCPCKCDELEMVKYL